MLNLCVTLRSHIGTRIASLKVMKKDKEKGYKKGSFGPDPAISLNSGPHFGPDKTGISGKDRSLAHL